MGNLPRTGAPELANNQASPEPTVNGMGRYFDANSHGAIIEDRDLSAAPGTCADGACYLVSGAPASGNAWFGKGGQLAIAVGTNAANGWLFMAVAVEGYELYVRDENVKLRHNGAAWVALTEGAATECIIVALSDESTAITTGSAKVTMHWPYNFTVTEVFTGVSTVSSSGSVTVDMNDAGSTIFSTNPSIAASGETSLAGTPGVISGTAHVLDKGDKVTFDIDAAGTGAKGLKVYVIGHQ